MDNYIQFVQYQQIIHNIYTHFHQHVIRILNRKISTSSHIHGVPPLFGHSVDERVALRVLASEPGEVRALGLGLRVGDIQRSVAREVDWMKKI